MPNNPPIQRDERLHPLSWQHHHGLVAALRLKNDTPKKNGDALAHWVKETLAFWRGDLLPHFRAEEECILPRLARHEKSKEIIARMLDEHIRLHRLALDAEEAASEAGQKAALIAFGELLQKHIRFEEREAFQICQKTLTHEEMAAIGKEINARGIGQTPPAIPGGVVCDLKNS